MSDHLTRKELRQDQVAVQVEATFGFLTTHRPQLIRYGGAGLAVIAIVGLGFWYRSYERGVREQALGDVVALESATVGPPPPNGGPNFPTEQARKDAVIKGFTKLMADHGGSAEAYVAEYELATMNAESGKVADARKMYQDVADNGGTNYASLARLALAQLDFSENKVADARKILQDLIDHPTDLVSKDQASYTLAKGLAASQPAEARKLLSAIASANSEVSQLAVTALGELPPQ